MISQETAREMLKMLKLAGNGGCQACIGYPGAKHSEFCCKVTAVITKAEEEA